MPKKFRVTGFTRFFLVMIIVAPLAYIAASYYNGEDGIGNLKRLLGLDKPGTEERFVPSDGRALEEMSEEEMQEQLEAQQKRLEDLKAENEKLRREISEQEEELSNLKNQ